MIENLDVLPFPDRSVLDNNPNIICSVMSSRGCSAYCTFCRATIKCEKKELQVRACSVSSFVDEIELLDHKYPIELFVFWDSTFNEPLAGGNERMLEFSREIKKRNLDLSFIINTRAELITEDSKEALKALAAVGMVSIEIGIESGNDKDLRLYGKPASLNDNKRALKIIRDSIPYVNIKPEFISVNPYSNYETLLKNFNFLHSVNLGFHVQRYMAVLYVYPQAAIKNKLSMDGLMSLETSYDANPLDYKFIDHNVGELWYILNENLNSQKFDTIELLEKMLSIFRAKVYRRLSQMGLQNKKYDVLFKEFDQLRTEENNKNYNLLCNCIKYLNDEASKEDVVLWCKELNKTKFLFKLNVLFRRLFWLIFSEKNYLKIIKNEDALPLIAKMMGVPLIILNIFLSCAKSSAAIKKALKI